jgi:hypothetical protein
VRSWRVFAVLASTAIVLTATAGTAVASTGKTLTSPESTGYAVTGARFKAVETWVTLPDPAKFAREVGQISVSVQLITPKRLIDLTATACTDATCRAGGKPETHKYRLQLAVYRRATHALICSTSAPGALRCPGAAVGKPLNTARIAPGRRTEIDLVYPPPNDLLIAAVNGHGYLYPVSTHSVFSQARIGLEFASTPWAHASFRAPAKAVAVASFGRPVPPPYFAEIVATKGSGGGIAFWWAHHALRMKGGPSGQRLEAEPGALVDHGYGFTVYLEP